jgi:hypothetical protein
VRAETAVVRQFVGDIVVVWTALAWLGVLQQRHGGAAWVAAWRWHACGAMVVQLAMPG